MQYFTHFCINDDYQTQSQPRQDSPLCSSGNDRLGRRVYYRVFALQKRYSRAFAALFTLSNFRQRIGNFYRFSEQYRIFALVGSTDTLGEYR